MIACMCVRACFMEKFHSRAGTDHGEGSAAYRAQNIRCLRESLWCLLIQHTATLTRSGYDITLSLSSVDWLLWTDGSAVQLSCRVRRVHECPRPPPPTALLAGRMNLASSPGQGLCLSHAWLDPRHFIALTLPPTVTAALNEAAHMCTNQVGSEPSVQLNSVCPISFEHNAVVEPWPI